MSFLIVSNFHIEGKKGGGGTNKSKPKSQIINIEGAQIGAVANSIVTLCTNTSSVVFI